MLGTLLEYVLSALNVTTSLLLVVSILAYVCYKSASRPAGFPPGPMALPAVGNILSLAFPMYGVFNKYAKQYGDIFSVKLGPNWCVVLNDYEVAKGAYLRKPVAFAGRPQSYSLEYLSGGYKDIALSSYNEMWKLHRKIGHAALRNFASGKKMEKLVYDVYPKLTHAIDVNKGKSFEPREVLGVAVLNILATMCFGHEFAFGDPKLKMWMDLTLQLERELGNGLPADFLSILKYVPDPKTKRCFKLVDAYEKELKAEFNAHRETYDPENIRDIIDALIKEQQEAIAEGSQKADSLTDVHLLGTLGDIFNAGTETTTTTLHWAIALMVKHPDIQEKIGQEVDKVIGRDCPPSLEDRGKLPYTEAALCELLRYSSVAPLGFIHTTIEDVTLGNYRIPKDTWVMVNHWAIHYSEKHWDEPHKFKPEHFLDESGEVRQHPEGFLPFSFGRRVCLGEAFAKAELFLLFSWLFQHYTFSKPLDQEGKFEIALDRSSDLMHQPQNYQITAKKRF